jgi:predicted RNA-binding Zn-ribbon protein involved in translation (DUF1610 family)
MALTLPESMDECVYFTNRTLLDDAGKPAGRAVCWVPRVKCLACKKGWMGKPHDAKTGKIKVRATEYVCSACGVSEEKKEHEERLSANAQYTCPSCGKSGEGTVPFARKTYQGVKAILFTCASCSGKIAITKKMKDLKKKKSKAAVEEALDDDDF